jgi:DNA invertase Pin-like site-specific DNA recombinase
MSISFSPFSSGNYIAAYLRDSGGDEQDLSIEQQEQSVRAWCKTNSLILTRIFKDVAQPGSSTIGRTAFQEMIHYFHGANVPEAGLIVWKFSRFARDLNDSNFYKADLRRLGKIIHSLNDSIPEGLDGQLIEMAIDWMSAKYLDDLKTDVKRGVHHLVDQYGALGGTPPVGFIRSALDLGRRRDGSPHIVHKWVPDPEKWEICRLAWEMRTQGASYKKIHEATHLYRTNSSYRDFFTNRLYLGELKFGDQVILDYAPALITREMWDKVQQIGQSRSHQSDANSSHGRISSFRLSGLLFCAICGSPMYGSVIKFNTRKRDRTSFGYYACTLQNRTSGRECNAKRIPKILLEEAVIQKIFDYFRRKDVIPIAMENLNNQDEILAIELIASTRIKAQQVASLKRRIGNVLNAIELRGLSETLSLRLDELEAEKKKVEMESPPPQPIKKVYNLDKTLEFLERLEGRVMNMPPTEANEFLRGVIKGINVQRFEKEVIGRVEIVKFPLEISASVMSGHGVPGALLPENITPPITFHVTITRRPYTFLKN